MALWEQLEGVDVAGSDDREVGAVEGQNLSDAEALGDGDDAGIGSAEGKVGVALDELRAAFQVLGVRAMRLNEPTAMERRKAASAAGVARVERK